MTSETGRTIGDVLNELKEEFEDITISKIRFLEAEGLISPDRTDSGYRQFTDADVDRLRYVLRAQRDRYLPLKVIREELERLDAGLPVDTGSATPDADDVQLVRGDDTEEGGGVEGIASDVQMDRQELAEAAGVSPEAVDGLADHGLLPDEGPYDGTQLATAKAAAGLLEIGLEPRHLRMYRQFADREAGLASQLVSPLLRQRNPDARERAGELLEVLAERGEDLHRAMLKRALDELRRS